MHIAIIAPEAIPVPPVRGGSVEVCITSIAKELAKSHRVTVYSRSHSAYPAVQIKGNLTMVRVGTGSPGQYIGNILKKMKGKHFDLIQVDNRPTFVPRVKSLFPNTPVSLFLHSLVFVTPPMLSLTKAAACLSKARVIVANSVSLKQELIKRFPAVKNKIEHVLLGADVNRFRPLSAKEREAQRNRYGLKGSFTVIFAGRLIPKKGVPVLLKAIAQVKKDVPNVRLLISGASQRPAYGASLKRLAARLHVPARFLGLIPHSRIHKIYGMADCFVCPSQYHEPFGLVNAEAAASGLPCIASRSGGIKEIFDHGKNGILIDNYHDPRSFAEAIRKLAHNREFAKKLGEQGRADMIRHFSWKRTASDLEDIYKRI